MVKEVRGRYLILYVEPGINSFAIVGGGNSVVGDVGKEVIEADIENQEIILRILEKPEAKPNSGADSCGNCTQGRLKRAWVHACFVTRLLALLSDVLDPSYGFRFRIRAKRCKKQGRYERAKHGFD